MQSTYKGLSIVLINAFLNIECIEIKDWQRLVLLADLKSLTLELHFDMRCKANHSKFACEYSFFNF